MSIAELIPTGKANAIKRKDLVRKCRIYGLVNGTDEGCDRTMRKLIEEARRDTVIINLSNGLGYYKPSDKDIDALKKYIAQEDARAKHAAMNHHRAKALLEDLKVGRV